MAHVASSADTDQIAFVRARASVLVTAAEAAALDGITPLEHAQMRTIADLAGLQFHRVIGAATAADLRCAEDDLRQVMNAFHGLVGAISRAVGVEATDPDLFNDDH